MRDVGPYLGGVALLVALALHWRRRRRSSFRLTITVERHRDAADNVTDDT